MCPRGDIFLSGESHMKKIKEHSSYTEQITKLRSRGYIITDDAACEQILKHNG